MKRLTYEQAFKDHSYLWGIAPASDMTGGYVDQDDLEKLLRSPTKATARQCLCNQIDYWFQTGPDFRGEGRRDLIDWKDPTICEIAKRHGCLPAHLESDDDDF